MEKLIDTPELARRTGISEVTWARRRVQGGNNTPQFFESRPIGKVSLERRGSMAGTTDASVHE